MGAAAAAASAVALGWCSFIFEASSCPSDVVAAAQLFFLLRGRAALAAAAATAEFKKGAGKGTDLHQRQQQKSGLKQKGNTFLSCG
jgi:hypothetical protein